MKHYFCPVCGSTSNELSVCETESCSNQWEMMTECDCSDGKHGMQNLKNDEILVVKDSNGNKLEDGDSVALIKDLPLKGSSKVYKRGTKVNNIKLRNNTEEIDCKIDGSSIVLRTEFLKKI